ncbi:MAG: Rrf2 family transcriptional regulator [Chitinophagaceae bacterium]
MFSKTCEYAIRAIIFIAQKSENGVNVGIKEIFKGINAPESFIAKILQELSRKGLIQSVKGPNGGFFLDEESKKNTLADIVKTIDGDKLFTGCALGLKNCSEIEPCPLHDEFKVIRQQMHNMLRNSTVAEFNTELAQGLKHLKR